MNEILDLTNKELCFRKIKQKLSMCKFVLKTIKGPYIFAFHPELNPA